MDSVKDIYVMGKTKEDVPVGRSKRINLMCRLLNKEDLTSSQLAERLNIGVTSVRATLRNFRDLKLVDCRNVGNIRSYFWTGEYCEDEDYSLYCRTYNPNERTRLLPKKFKVVKPEAFWLLGGEIVR